MSRKLIRDRMGINIGLGPGDSVSLATDEKDYEKLLIAKLEEEYGEVLKELVRREPNPERLMEELADLYEVMTTITDRFCSCDANELHDVAKKKRDAKGGFTAGIVLSRRHGVLMK